MNELEKLVERLGSQAEAARVLKVQPSQVCEWLKGTRGIPPYIMELALEKNKGKRK